MALKGHKSRIKKAKRIIRDAKQQARTMHGRRGGNALPEHARCTLMRGQHELPHQSQVLSRDLTAEDINKAKGKKATGFAVKEGHSLQHDYKFIVYSPGRAGSSWTAFHTPQALHKFVKAYGLKLSGGLKPGDMFNIVIPRKPKMAKLRCK